MGDRKKLSAVRDSELRLGQLDKLVSELTCTAPKIELLKEQMNRLGIEFSEDPTERLSRVLFLIQKIQFDFNEDLPEFRMTEDSKVEASRNKKVRKDGIEI